MTPDANLAGRQSTVRRLTFLSFQQIALGNTDEIDYTRDVISRQKDKRHTRRAKSDTRGVFSYSLLPC